MPVVLQHIPAGSSTKTVLHYGQEIKFDGNFQQYDYGIEGNLKQYGTKTPPLYDLTKIEVPMYLMYSTNDFFASPIVSISADVSDLYLFFITVFYFQDVLRMSKQLTNLVGMYLIPLKKFNHVDFLFGKDAFKVVYEPLVKVLKNYTVIAKV